MPVAIGADRRLAGFLGIIAATEAPQKVFDFLVSSSGALIVFVYMTIVVAQIVLRRRRERARRTPAGDPDVAVSVAVAAGARRHGGRAVAMAVTPGLQQDF